jgi:hypothetical protein
MVWFCPETGVARTIIISKLIQLPKTSSGFGFDFCDQNPYTTQVLLIEISPDFISL